MYVYNPIEDKVKDGLEGDGIVVLAVDNLPCELPRESSTSFSNSLWGFVPSIVKADFESLPPEIKRAVIVYKGRLTPDYRYLEEYL